MSNKKTYQPFNLSESFANSSHESIYDLDNYPTISDMSSQLEENIDTIECHPSCCGSQWPISLDGLTAKEIQQKMALASKDDQYIRTNYTCANGKNGVGCPCISKDMYMKLVNRGQNVNYSEKLASNPKNTMASIQNDLLTEQDFGISRKMNDLELQRQPQDLSNVQSYGSAMY